VRHVRDESCPERRGKSVHLDGWWDEWFDPAYGWEIPSAEGADGLERRDDLEAKALYDIIENEIVPRFYDLDQRALPERGFR
jgi:starch phosphorylase